MIRSFRDSAVEDIFNGRSSRGAGQRLPRELWLGARRRLDALDQAEVLEDLQVPPGNRFEAFKGDRKGQYSIRINDQYRICFRWTESGPAEVEIVDYH